MSQGRAPRAFSKVVTEGQHGEQGPACRVITFDRQVCAHCCPLARLPYSIALVRCARLRHGLIARAWKEGEGLASELRNTGFAALRLTLPLPLPSHQEVGYLRCRRTKQGGEKRNKTGKTGKEAQLPADEHQSREHWCITPRQRINLAASDR